MSELELGRDAGIGEEQVAESGPFVRALAVQRLEMIWRACEPHIQISDDQLELGFRPDPRFIEAGIRVVDRLVGLYGLLKPISSVSTGPGEDREVLRERALDQVAQLEERVRNPE